MGDLLVVLVLQYIFSTWRES